LKKCFNASHEKKNIVHGLKPIGSFLTLIMIIPAVKVTSLPATVPQATATTPILKTNNKILFKITLTNKAPIPQ
jgi:hypothetical protein